MKGTVLVCGGSSGIGERVVANFVRKGYKVVNLSRTNCEVAGVDNISVDFSVRGQAKEAVGQAVKGLGSVDILIYCAGTTVAGSVEDTDIELARRVFEVNYWGAVEVVQSVLPVMRSSGRGSIVLVGSVAGTVPLPFESFYSCTKAALDMLAQGLRLELKRFNISITCQNPGATATPLTSRRPVVLAERSPYADELTSAVSTVSDMESNGANANYVAKKIVATALAKDPAAVGVVGAKNAILSYLSRLMPMRLKTFVIEKRFALNQTLAQPSMTQKQPKQPKKTVAKPVTAQAYLSPTATPKQKKVHLSKKSNR